MVKDISSPLIGEVGDGGTRLPRPEVFEEDVWYTATKISRGLSISRDTVVRWGQSSSVKALPIGPNVRYLGAALRASGRNVCAGLTFLGVIAVEMTV